MVTFWSMPEFLRRLIEGQHRLAQLLQQRRLCLELALCVSKPSSRQKNICRVSPSCVRTDMTLATVCNWAASGLSAGNAVS